VSARSLGIGDVTPGTSKASVLLLAGEVRDEWKAALEAAGLEVHTTGWLDAIPFARLNPPDVVVASADLPRNAPQLLLNAFRGSAGFGSIPVVVAGLRPDEIETDTGAPPLLAPADHYVPAPVIPRALGAEVREIARTGRVPQKRTLGQWIALWLAGSGIALLGAYVVAQFLGLAAEQPPGGSLVRVSGALLAAGATCLGVGATVAFVVDRRPLTPHRRRRAIAWFAFFAWQLAFTSGPVFHGLELVMASVAALAGAAWAWLGRSVKPRGPAARRWLAVLAVFLVALAIATLLPLVARP
jgi:MFS family permease